MITLDAVVKIRTALADVSGLSDADFRAAIELLTAAANSKPPITSDMITKADEAYRAFNPGRLVNPSDGTCGAARVRAMLEAALS